MEGLLGDAQAVNRLAEALEKCPEVAKFSRRGHNEAGAIAHAFSDLEQAFTAFLGDHLPRLLQEAVQGRESVDVLLDIGEEFRQILYHLRELEFYQYLQDDANR